VDAYIKCREVAHRLFEELERARAEIVVPGIILEEVWRNIAAPRGKASFMAALLSPRVLVLTERVPERLARKYSRHGLGNGDHMIAAFAELANADLLITEDRDFHVIKGRGAEVPFKVLNAAEALELLRELSAG